MNKINEFWYCASPQDELPLYSKDTITTDNIQQLINFLNLCKTQKIQLSTFPDTLNNIILEYPDYINNIRKLIGISDKRLYLDLSFIFNRSKDKNNNNILKESRITLKKHDTDFFINKVKKHKDKEYFADIISKYFIDKGIFNIIQTFISLDEDSVTKIFNYLIDPREVQQKEAKLRGHGAEMSVASVLKNCNMSIYPEDKHINTMGSKDPNVDLSCMKIVDKDPDDENIHSFDIIVKDDDGDIRILIQSLIHSSDPGQYGVDKSNETVTIKKLINQYNSKNTDKQVLLWGVVDGIGFIENPNNTIVKMINNFDSFFQINTLFKIAISLSKLNLIDNLIGISFDTNYFEDFMIKYFEQTYLCDSTIVNMTGKDISKYNSLNAGKATLIFK